MNGKGGGGQTQAQYVHGVHDCMCMIVCACIFGGNVHTQGNLNIQI